MCGVSPAHFVALQFASTAGIESSCILSEIRLLGLGSVVPRYALVLRRAAANNCADDSAFAPPSRDDDSGVPRLHRRNENLTKLGSHLINMSAHGDCSKWWT